LLDAAAAAAACSLQCCHDLNSISSQPTTDAFFYLNLCLFSFPDITNSGGRVQMFMLLLSGCAMRLRALKCNIQAASLGHSVYHLPPVKCFSSFI
jgi:hypothetical protein